MNKFLKNNKSLRCWILFFRELGAGDLRAAAGPTFYKVNLRVFTKYLVSFAKIIYILLSTDEIQLARLCQHPPRLDSRYLLLYFYKKHTKTLLMMF
jgi:hypothetical protein